MLPLPSISFYLCLSLSLSLSLYFNLSHFPFFNCLCRLLFLDLFYIFCFKFLFASVSCLLPSLSDHLFLFLFHFCFSVAFSFRIVFFFLSFSKQLFEQFCTHFFFPKFLFFLFWRQIREEDKLWNKSFQSVLYAHNLAAKKSQKNPKNYFIFNAFLKMQYQNLFSYRNSGSHILD
jgi:hypothetical protein